MELWDIYDQDRNLTGKTMVRGEPYADGAFHLIIHVCIFNDNGQLLIQQRQPFKKGWPNLWDVTVGGSAVAGENSRQAAEREVLEEIGYKVDLANQSPMFSFHFTHGFDDYYILHSNPQLSDLTLQPEEVQAVAWADRAQIQAMTDEGRFIPYRPHFIDLLFDLQELPSLWQH